ncbi:MAG: fibronectin type III domain-containing protein [Proteobacteria bacterium]|nr:fibronectin type III domain-containing protein [Pseudomonadota bacterium]
MLFAAKAKTTDVDNTAMTVLWQTNETPTTGATIRWGTSPDSYGSPVTVPESGNGQDEHQFNYIITGLTPGSLYYYQVDVDSNSSSGSFRTPPDTSSTSLTFYGYGDIRGNELYTDTEFEQHSIVEEKIMKDVSHNASVRQTFLINASDFVNCGMDEHYWDRQYFNKTLKGSRMFMANLPLVAPIGNHEGYWAGILDSNNNCIQSSYPYTGMTTQNACHITETTSPGETFNKYIPYTFYPKVKTPGNYKDYYYLTDYGPARFIMMDVFFSTYASGTPQYNWVSGNMRPLTRWNIPVFHAPMWATRYPINPGLAEKLREVYSPVFEANYVPVVIQGHQHFYSRLFVNGTTYLTLGGGGAELTKITPEDPVSAPYIVKTYSIYHYARFEISGNTMTATVMDISGNTLDAFKIFPPATNVSPVNSQTTSTCAPTLSASSFVSQDGATHQGSQWIVREASDNSIVYVTSCIDASTNTSYSCFDTKNLTTFTTSLLECSHNYQWQVVYQDSNGNTTQASTVTPFFTPAQTAQTNAYGVPVNANQVNDKAGTPVSVVKGSNVVALQADPTFRASVPQIDSVAAILSSGSVTEPSGSVVSINPAGFSLVNTQGGVGQSIAVVADGSGTIASIMPINNSGYTLSDNSGNMKQVATFAIPSGTSSPYGIFDFIVNVTPKSTTKIIFVPPVPFAQGTKWYKFDSAAGALKEYPNFEVNAQGVGILTLKDNEEGDADSRSGIVRDPGGPLVSAPAAIFGSSSSGCFIATAAYGSYLHPFVKILRVFRDTVLLGSSSGRSFVEWYYRVSPSIAGTIRTSEVMKAGVRILLLPAVGFSYLSLTIGVVPTLFMLLLLVALAWLGIRSLYQHRRNCLN